MKYIVERVKLRAQSWKHKLLSMAGKEILIKAILQALPTYVMSIFKIPTDIINQVEVIIRRFWWGSSDNKKKLVGSFGTRS